MGHENPKNHSQNPGKISPSTKVRAMNSTSLTGFIAEDETLEIINNNFINPIKRTGAKIITSPTKGNGVDYGAIGTAYD
jgi:hypothetical protein